MSNIVKRKEKIDQLVTEIFTSQDSFILKSDINNQQLADKLYNVLLSVIKDESVSDKCLNSAFFADISRNLLKKLVKVTDLEDFKSVVCVFEKIVNAEGIYGTTGYFRSLLLAAFSEHDMKKQEDRLEYICQSKTLQGTDNQCDKITDIEDFQIFTDKFYASYMLKAWYIMSLFHENKSIVEYAYPDNATVYISGFDITNYLNLGLSRKIDLFKLDPVFFRKKFTKNLLSEIQNELSTGKIKLFLNKAISDELSIEEKKKLILEPLGELRIGAFEEMKKLYPGILEQITFQDILKMKTYSFSIEKFRDDRKKASNSDSSMDKAFVEKDENGNYVLNMDSDSTDGENYQKLLPLIKKYGIVLVDGQKDEDLLEKLVNNVWKIVSKQQVTKQKKELKKLLPKNKKGKVVTLQRL